MKFRNIAAATVLAGATAIAGAGAASAAASHSDDPATQDYYNQVEKDWGTYVNDYFPGGYIPSHYFTH